MLEENAQLRRNLANALPRLERDPRVMVTGREFSLWDSHTQTVDLNKISTNPTNGTPNKLRIVPAKAARCEDGSRQQDTPPSVTGRALSKALSFGVYADPSWTFQTCWTNPRWTATQNVVTGTRREVRVDPESGDREFFVYYKMARQAHAMADFKEFVTAPGHDGAGPTKILGRTVTTRNAGAATFCTWESPEDPDGTPPPSTCPRPGDAAPFVRGGNLAVEVSARTEANAGNAQAARLLADRRGDYYALVAQRLGSNALPEARALNTNMELLQAYTDLALPQAKESDDQLRALVYGKNGLPANLERMPALQAIFSLAAENQHKGRPWQADQTLVDLMNAFGCASMGLETDDPVANCVVANGQARSSILDDRLEVHFQAIRRGEESQTLPLVDEAIRNLELVSQYVRALPPSAGAAASKGAAARTK